MTNKIVTFQSVFIDVTGTKLTTFEIREVMSETECQLSVVNPTSKGAVTHIINKDPMFKGNSREYVLSEFKTLSTAGKGLAIEYYRYVLGDATSTEAKTDCFNEINESLAAYYNKKSHGYYLDSDGNLFKKDSDGRGLLIDYVVVKGTLETTWGWVHRYPERTDNHPIEPLHTVQQLKEPNDIKITIPKMTVNQWLDTDIEDLLTDADRARIAKNRAEREENDEIKCRRIRELRDYDKSNKKRLAAWEKRKALDIKKNGNQLALL